MVNYILVERILRKKIKQSINRKCTWKFWIMCFCVQITIMDSIILFSFFHCIMKFYQIIFYIMKFDAEILLKNEIWTILSSWGGIMCFFVQMILIDFAVLIIFPFFHPCVMSSAKIFYIMKLGAKIL